ncbi:MAG: agmatine deiminase family protein [Sandaracinus sp.]|nr:agmatine deiminase family protein [Myxococcales bacterium]MCB9619250.1 agmatine deiminase family protein [Sandaracinus sp.]MCB9631430.1 agmatine deiminase family protein [Sandaracinus sp.]
MFRRIAVFVLATCAPLPFGAEPAAMLPRDAHAAVRSEPLVSTPPVPRLDAYGDLRGRRLVLAWTEGASDHASVFGPLLALATLEERPPLVLLVPEVSPSTVRSLVRRHGGDPTNLELVSTPLDTFWIRDFGPQVVGFGGHHYLVDFPYDTERPDDDNVPALLAARFGLAIRPTEMDIEGGHLVVEGGVCITNDDVVRRGKLLGWTKAEVADELETLFGCRRVVYVPALEGEPTGHVDLYVAATGHGRVLVGRYSPEQDATNARRLDRAARQLEQAGLTVTRIPMPSNAERTLFRSYTNLVVLPSAALIPRYLEDRSVEDEAYAILRAELPGKTLHPLVTDELIELEGALHCVALTLPF